MKETKVITLNEFREKLVGLESMPTVENKKCPTIILVHGFGVTKEESGMFDEIARRLAETDFLVYRFDFSGCGESEGDYSETSLTKLKSDLSSILEFVQLQPQVDTSRIGILGQSLGTATAITLEPKVKCLVMMSSVSNPRERLVELFGDGYHPEAISVRKRSAGNITRVKPQFWQDFDNHNLLKSIKEIHSPILFIHGSEDNKCPISEMEAYFEKANEPKKKVIIEGADHGLRPYREKMYQIVVDWFKKWLT